MSEPPETCAGCRFDGAEYDLDDALGTLRALAPVWHETVEGIDERVLLARPAPHVWSAAEYTAHAADVTQAMGRLLHGSLTIDDLEVEAVPEGHAAMASAPRSSAWRPTSSACTTAPRASAPMTIHSGGAPRSPAATWSMPP